MTTLHYIKLMGVCVLSLALLAGSGCVLALGTPGPGCPLCREQIVFLDGSAYTVDGRTGNLTKASEADLEDGDRDGPGHGND